MISTVLWASITALIMCFVASVVEDFLIPRRRNKDYRGSVDQSSFRNRVSQWWSGR